ncbi:MAG TPA: LLM class flavin-dependent oxidoreductase [Solirubrobacterales bacterium]|nr:LLM class flavin-dependent oxidoreductase [Solirubrobacterales bacterium]
MKVDILYELDCPKPWAKPHPWGQREIEQRTYFEMLEQVKLADKMGFATSWHVEHHFREGRSHSPAPEVTIGALSQVTEQIKLGFGVTLTPHRFTHPARVAEKVATADILSKGRVEWGIGRSTPMEQASFGVDGGTSRESMLAAAHQVSEMWAAEYYECNDEFLEFPRRMVTPKPWQDPHPPCWMATSSPGGATLAGKLGLGLLTFAVLRPVVAEGELGEQESVAAILKEYRAAGAEREPLTGVVNDRVAVHTLMHCAPSLADAESYGIWDSVWWWYRSLVEFIMTWEMAELPEEERANAFPLMNESASESWDPKRFNDEDMIIVGDPERCYEKMLRYAEQGVDHLICQVMFGGVPHEHVMRSIELMGTEVLPALARHGVETEVAVRAGER